MNLGEIFEMLYIKAYFKDKISFFKDFFEKIECTLDLSDASIMNLYKGEIVSKFYKSLKDFKLDKGTVVSQIESYYKKMPISDYYTDYTDKTYKEALYEQAKAKNLDITMEAMSDYIATQLINELNVRIQAKNQNEEEPNASTQLNALSKNVKEEIRKVLSDIFTSLKAMDAFAVEYQCFHGLIKENKDEEKESKVLNSLKKEFDNFEELETKLFSYTDIYPEQTILKDLCIKMMDISLFYYIDSETYLKSIKVIDKSNEILKDSEDCPKSINVIDESKEKLKSLINALS